MKKRYAKVGRYRVVVEQGRSGEIGVPPGGPGATMSARFCVRRYFLHETWTDLVCGAVEWNGCFGWCTPICPEAANWIAPIPTVHGCSLEDLADFCEALKTAYRLAAEVVGQ